MVKLALQRSHPRVIGAVATATVAALISLSAQAQTTPTPPPIRDDTRPTGVRATAFQFGIGFPGAYMKVTWGRPRRVPSSYVLGYVVQRLDAFSGQQVIAGTLTDSVKSVIDSESARTISAYDGTPGQEAGDPADFDVTGIQPGQVYSYQVSSAYVNGLQDRDGDGERDDEEFMSPLSSRTGFVTAIAPPTIVQIDEEAAGGNQVDLSQFIISWQQTPGADSYVIWIASDPDFKKKIQINGPRTVPVDFGGDPIVSQQISANSSKFRRATRLFIAVGARNSGDPKPKPFGAIFSTPVQVVPLGTPPPPPGGGGGGGGGGGNPPPPPN